MVHQHRNRINGYCLSICTPMRSIYTKPNSPSIPLITSFCWLLVNWLFTISKNSSTFHSIQYFLNISCIFIFISFIIGSLNTHFLSHNSTSLSLYQSKNSCKLITIFIYISSKKADRQTKKTYLLFYGGNHNNYPPVFFV